VTGDGSSEAERLRSRADWVLIAAALMLLLVNIVQGCWGWLPWAILIPLWIVGLGLGTLGGVMRHHATQLRERPEGAARATTTVD